MQQTACPAPRQKANNSTKDMMDVAAKGTQRVMFT
jgi:hypothetical protein